MALYKSNYPELSFYVNNERKQFSNGEYRTDNKAELEALGKLADAIIVEEAKTEPKPAPKAEAKSAPKRTTAATKK